MLVRVGALHVARTVLQDNARVVCPVVSPIAQHSAQRLLAAQLSTTIAQHSMTQNSTAGSILLM